MEEKLFLKKDSLKGYIKICFWGREPERFLNLCAHHKIRIRRIQKEKGIYQGELLISDFYRIDGIRRKTGMKIKIKKKYGVPFFFNKNRKRKVFFIGIILAFLYLFLLSTRIWNIHVEGNVHNSTQSILNSLETMNVYHGMKREDVDCGYISGQLRKEFPDITWVSAKLTGTRLLLEIKENENYEQILDEETPCDLCAKKEGEIVSIIVRKGSPKKQVGDSCKKGEVLVSGRVPIKNDSQEIVRYQLVQADADIEIEYKMNYYQQFPLKYQKTVSTGKVRQGYVFQVGAYYLQMNQSLKKQDYNQIKQLQQLKLTENFKLPFFYGKSIAYEVMTKEAIYTKKEAEEKARRAILKTLETLSQKGIQISENHVRIEINKTSCVTKGSLTLIEKATSRVLLETERNNSIDEQYN